MRLSAPRAPPAGLGERVASVLARIRRLDYPFGPFFRLLLLTGARLNELAGARWREFDLERKTWTIPAERFKSDAEHMVPLTNDALAVLATLPRFARATSCLGLVRQGAGSRVHKAKERLDRHMLDALREIAEARRRSKAVELVPFVNHDLRRTVRTRLSALKVQDHIAEGLSVMGEGIAGYTTAPVRGREARGAGQVGDVVA